VSITTHSLDQVAALCSGAKKSSDGWRAPCPAHGGKDPNLHIWERDGAVYLECHSHKCDYLDIVRAIGLDQKHSPSGILGIYDYVDEGGNLRHQTVRYSKTRKPPFSQRRPDPANPGSYIWDLKGVDRVLY
jgi:hypothetical protein